MSFKDAASNYANKIPNFKAYEDSEDKDINTFKITARQWLSRAEDFFTIKNILESRKSLNIVGSLLDFSYTWLENARVNCTGDYLPWNKFKKVFRQHAILGEGEIMVCDKFNILNWNIYKYKNSLAKPEPEGDGMTMARFLNGLSKNLQTIVVSKKPLLLTHAVNIAFATEAENGSDPSYQDENYLFKIGRPGRILKSNKRFFNKNRSRYFNYSGNSRRIIIMVWILRIRVTAMTIDATEIIISIGTIIIIIINPIILFSLNIYYINHN